MFAVAAEVSSEVASSTSQYSCRGLRTKRIQRLPFTVGAQFPNMEDSGAAMFQLAMPSISAECAIRACHGTRHRCADAALDKHSGTMNHEQTGQHHTIS